MGRPAIPPDVWRARERTVRRLRERGHAVERIASALGVTSSTVQQMEERQDRAAKIIALRAGGSTLQAIADVMGVSRERVRQLEARGGGTIAPDHRPSSVDPLRLIAAIRRPEIDTMHAAVDAAKCGYTEALNVLQALGMLPAVRRLLSIRHYRGLFARRAQMVDTARALAQRLGRDPRNDEIFEAVFGHPPRNTEAMTTLAGYWTANSSKLEARRGAMPELRRRAGLGTPKRGAPAHQSRAGKKCLPKNAELHAVRLASFGRTFQNSDLRRHCSESLTVSTLAALARLGSLRREGSGNKGSPFQYTKQE